jgi:xanthine phosphoribosyltransferase
MGLPVIFAKKHEALNLDKEIYTSKVFSHTKNKEYIIKVAKKLISPEDKVLIIDDFLANGLAALGLIDIVEQAGASVSGVGIAIEKAFQKGGKLIRNKGYDLYSLAVIESMENGVVFG